MPAISDVLDIRAGRKALEMIRADGLPQSSIKVMAGASGGPKWFVLSGLDKVLLGDYFKGREEPLELLGTSAGSWRFSCFAHSNPLAAHHRFEQGYLHTQYSEKPTANEVSTSARDMVKQIMGEDGADQILANPVMRLNLIAARSHGLLKSDARFLQGLGLGLAATGNLLSRKNLSYFFTRTVFYHPAYDQNNRPAFLDVNDLPTQRVRLSADNLMDAIMASGSIPMVMEGIADIKGAEPGMYRDGGITDYHFDMPFHKGEGLVLYPHFYSRMVPGWFDKALKHRRPAQENIDNVVLVSPSAEFVASLPYGKIPDRVDFQRFTYKDRVRYWERVIKESDRLGERFMALVADDKIAEVVKPL